MLQCYMYDLVLVVEAPVLVFSVSGDGGDDCYQSRAQSHRSPLYMEGWGGRTTLYWANLSSAPVFLNISHQASHTALGQWHSATNQPARFVIRGF